MDIILFMIVLHIGLYAPYFLDSEKWKGETGDTVLPKGVPYYCDGKFVRLMEI